MDIPITRVRLAIIGAGGIAHAHADAAVELSASVELVAVVDVDEVRAAEFAKKYAIPSVYADVGELFASEALDLVHICTPPQTHAPLAILAAHSGVRALVEKPTALSLKEFDAIAVASRSANVPVLTVFQHRFGAAAVRLRELVRDGRLGRALLATCETLWHRDASYFDAPWRGRWEIEGGGPTMGHGIHQFDLLLSILGPWARLSAFAGRQSLPTDTEDVSLAVVEFDNGALATVINSIVSTRESSRLRFDFEYATVEVEHVYGYSEADWTFTPAAGHEALGELWSQGGGDERSSHRDQLAAIVSALTNGEEPPVGIDDARMTLEFAAATYASAFRVMPIRRSEIGVDDPFYASMDGGHVPWPRVKEGVR